MAVDVEIRYCPLGPPQVGTVRYAYCSECKGVRKSTKDCPMVATELPLEPERTP